MKAQKRFKKVISALMIIGILIPPSACQNGAKAETVPQAEPTPAPAPPPQRNIKLALLLDTSGSMNGLIDQAKAQLWNVVNELASAKCDGVNPNLQIALYQYGNDGLPASEGYIQMVTPLTGDLDEISASLFKLTTNGGSEFCGQVIQTSLNQLDWNNNTDDYKVIFIAGNEEFVQGSVAYQQVCNRAKAEGIVVNTIHCGNFQVGINQSWKNAADLTGGKYLAIDHNSKTEYIPTPYDDQISSLNDSLNVTYLAYGSTGRSKKQMMESEDMNAESYGKSNKVSRAVSKSKHVYKNDSWDLVDAAKEKDFKIAEVDETTLPKEMQQMNNLERDKYIQKQSNKRSSIQKEISVLDRKRREYITNTNLKAKRAKNQLGDVILQAVREQARAKSFDFPNS